MCGTDAQQKEQGFALPCGVRSLPASSGKQAFIRDQEKKSGLSVFIKFNKEALCLRCSELPAVKRNINQKNNENIITYHIYRN